MKPIFGLLNQLNKILLPSLATKDPAKLTKFQKAITAWRYWVLTKSKS